MKDSELTIPYDVVMLLVLFTEGGEQQTEQPAGEGEEQQAEEPAGESGEQQAEGGEAAAEGAEQQAEQPPAEGGNVSAPMKIVCLFVCFTLSGVFSFVLFLFVCLFVVLNEVYVGHLRQVYILSNKCSRHLITMIFNE